MIGMAAMVIAGLTANYYFNVPVNIVDDKKEQKFTLEIKNTTKKTFCLSTSNWPKELGKLESSSETVWVTIGNKKFYYTLIQDVCPDCRLKIKSGEVAMSSLSYSDFGIPQYLYENPKTLHFSVTAVRCGY